MPTPTDTQPKRRLGGRSARVRQSVLDATLTLLAERGPAGLTVAEIAARADVHETSIYRRWGDPRNLVNEALNQFTGRTIPIPDTGSLRGDLIELHVASVPFLLSPLGQALIASALAAPLTPEYDAPVAGYWRVRAEKLAELFERASARGEWRSDEDMQSILPRLIGPLYFRCFFLRLDTGPDDIAKLIDDFLTVGPRAME